MKSTESAVRPDGCGLVKRNRFPVGDASNRRAARPLGPAGTGACL